MNAIELFRLRDELLDDARRSLDAAERLAEHGQDSRSWCGVANARRELAFTVDTIAGRAKEREDLDPMSRAGDGGAS